MIDFNALMEFVLEPVTSTISLMFSKTKPKYKRPLLRESNKSSELIKEKIYAFNPKIKWNARKYKHIEDISGINAVIR